MKPLAALALLALAAPAPAQTGSLACEHYLATVPDISRDPMATMCLADMIGRPRESLMAPRPRPEDRRLRPDLPLYLPGDGIPQTGRPLLWPPSWE